MKKQVLVFAIPRNFIAVAEFWAKEEGLPLMILSDHFETAPGLIISNASFSLHNIHH